MLRGGLVFDGTGSEPAAGTVVMERNRIAAVLPEGATDWPAEGARVLDVSGHTVLPGLMDLHTHLTYTELDVPQALTVHPAHAALRGVERLHAFIGSGITSVRDTSSFGTVPFILKEWVRDNRLPGPRVFAAGQLITATGGHSAEGLSVHSGVYGAVVEASGADGFREAVREQFKRGADLIKVASHFSREEIAAAVDEAHTLGLRITVDSETVYTEWAVEAGVDAIEHTAAAHRRSHRHDGAARDRLGADGRPLRLHLRVDGQLPRLDVAPIRAHRRNDPRDAAKDEGSRRPDRARHRPGLRLVP